MNTVGLLPFAAIILFIAATSLAIRLYTYKTLYEDMLEERNAIARDLHFEREERARISAKINQVYAACFGTDNT